MNMTLSDLIKERYRLNNEGKDLTEIQAAITAELIARQSGSTAKPAAKQRSRITKVQSGSDK